MEEQEKTPDRQQRADREQAADSQEEQPRFQVSDRRFWVTDESRIETASVPDRKYPTFVEELKARTELAEQRLKEKLDSLDKENEAFRARLTREFEKRLEKERLDLLHEFLEILDNFELALEAGQQAADFESLREGVRLNLDLFLSRLKALGVEPIDALNRPFDPHEAEAVGTVDVDDPERDQVVVEIVKRGYRCREQLLRPALVRVGRYQAKPSNVSGSQ